MGRPASFVFHVIAGLDPAILVPAADARIESAHDAEKLPQ
jgi:hypothetical protein